MKLGMKQLNDLIGIYNPKHVWVSADLFKDLVRKVDGGQVTFGSDFAYIQWSPQTRVHARGWKGPSGILDLVGPEAIFTPDPVSP